LSPDCFECLAATAAVAPATMAHRERKWGNFLVYNIILDLKTIIYMIYAS